MLICCTNSFEKENCNELFTGVHGSPQRNGTNFIAALCLALLERFVIENTIFAGIEIWDHTFFWTNNPKKRWPLHSQFAAARKIIECGLVTSQFREQL